MNTDSKALINRQEICDYLRIGKNVLYSLVKDGLPVKQVGGWWVGHKEELDEWFQVKNAPAPVQGEKATTER